MGATRLAVFSPVPPAPTGVADYLVDLLPALPDDWEIDVFVGDQEPPDEAALAGRARCFSHREWRERHGRAPYDLNVYQVGNNVLHAYAWPRVLEDPGLLVLHDVVVHPARFQEAGESGDLERYRRAARRCRPDVGDDLGHLIAGGLYSPSLLNAFPLCDDLVRASRLTAVHGELLAAWLEAVVPGARVHPLVHWRSVPEVDEERVDGWRRRLVGDADGPVLGAFGYVGAAHRLDAVLDALAELAPDHPFVFAAVGSVDPSLGLRERSRRLGLEGRVRWLGRVDELDFAALMRVVDAAVALRYPTARASSGVVTQMLRVGVPVAVSDLVHWRDLPDAAVARIPTGPREAESAALIDALRRWLRDPDARRAAAVAGRRWSRKRVTAEAMAASWIEAVERARKPAG